MDDVEDKGADADNHEEVIGVNAPLRADRGVMAADLCAVW